jgi:hypothetical protein
VGRHYNRAATASPPRARRVPGLVTWKPACFRLHGSSHAPHIRSDGAPPESRTLAPGTGRVLYRYRYRYGGQAPLRTPCRLNGAWPPLVPRRCGGGHGGAAGTKARGGLDEVGAGRRLWCDAFTRPMAKGAHRSLCRRTIDKPRARGISRPASAVAWHLRQAVRREPLEESACGSSQVAGQIGGYGLACSHDVGLDAAVAPREPEFDCADQS